MLDEVVRIGGSRAQRDLINNTLLAAYIKDGRPEAAHAMVEQMTDRSPSVRSRVELDARERVGPQDG